MNQRDGLIHFGKWSIPSRLFVPTQQLSIGLRAGRRLKRNILTVLVTPTLSTCAVFSSRICPTGSKYLCSLLYMTPFSGSIYQHTNTVYRAIILKRSCHGSPWTLHWDSRQYCDVTMISAVIVSWYACGPEREALKQHEHIAQQQDLTTIASR